MDRDAWDYVSYSEGSNESASSEDDEELERQQLRSHQLLMANECSDTDGEDGSEGEPTSPPQYYYFTPSLPSRKRPRRSSPTPSKALICRNRGVPAYLTPVSHEDPSLCPHFGSITLTGGMWVPSYDPDRHRGGGSKRGRLERDTDDLQDVNNDEDLREEIQLVMLRYGGMMSYRASNPQNHSVLNCFSVIRVTPLGQETASFHPSHSAPPALVSCRAMAPVAGAAAVGRLANWSSLHPALRAANPSGSAAAAPPRLGHCAVPLDIPADVLGKCLSALPRSSSSPCGSPVTPSTSPSVPLQEGKKWIDGQQDQQRVYAIAGLVLGGTSAIKNERIKDSWGDSSAGRTAALANSRLCGRTMAMPALVLTLITATTIKEGREKVLKDWIKRRREDGHSKGITATAAAATTVGDDDDDKDASSKVEYRYHPLYFPLLSSPDRCELLESVAFATLTPWPCDDARMISLPRSLASHVTRENKYITDDGEENGEEGQCFSFSPSAAAAMTTTPSQSNSHHYHYYHSQATNKKGPPISHFPRNDGVGGCVPHAFSVADLELAIQDLKDVSARKKRAAQFPALLHFVVIGGTRNGWQPVPLSSILTLLHLHLPSWTWWTTDLPTLGTPPPPRYGHSTTTDGEGSGGEAMQHPLLEPFESSSSSSDWFLTPVLSGKERSERRTTRHLYLYGGVGAQRQYLCDTYQLNCQTRVWREVRTSLQYPSPFTDVARLAATPGGRAHHVLLALLDAATGEAEALVVVGGEGGSGPHGGVWCFRFSTGLWEPWYFPSFHIKEEGILRVASPPPPPGQVVIPHVWHPPQEVSSGGDRDGVAAHFLSRCVGALPQVMQVPLLLYRYRGVTPEKDGGCPHSSKPWKAGILVMGGAVTPPSTFLATFMAPSGETLKELLGLYLDAKALER